MTDDPVISAEQERSMWLRLANSPYIAPEERREFALRAAEVEITREREPSLNAAIRRELDAREQGQIVAILPPGMCVSHSVNATAHVAQAEQLTSSGTFSVADSILPQFAARAVSWDNSWGRQQPEYVGNMQSDFGRLLSRLLGGVVRSIGLNWRGGEYKRLTLEIDVPTDMSYETVVANLQRFARELAVPGELPDTGRRRLLKLEKEAV